MRDLVRYWKNAVVCRTLTLLHSGDTSAGVNYFNYGVCGVEGVRNKNCD